jgi:hypothetical protein
LSRIGGESIAPVIEGPANQVHPNWTPVTEGQSVSWLSGAIVLQERNVGLELLFLDNGADALDATVYKSN